MNSMMYEQSNSKAFYNMAWIAFIISFIGMGAGLAHLSADFAMKGFIAITYIFSITSCFTVAKVVRDRHESERLINKVEHAKTERLLTEYSEPNPHR